jgi:hypothetical protein
MRNVILLLLVVGLCFGGWLYRDKLPWIKGTGEPGAPGSDGPIPALSRLFGGPTPIPTPHPAAEARAAAIRAYPALGIKDSALNKKFVVLYSEAQRDEPGLLAQPDWPITLAGRAAVAIGGGAIPVPVATPRPRPSGLKGTILDQSKPGH